MKFSKAVITEMKDLVKLTHKSRKENGGILCSDDKNKITLENICKGTLCVVTIENRECSNNRKYVGTYHTHPTGTAHDEILPSAKDLYNRDITCIGQKIKDTEQIKCFDMKNKNYVPERDDSLYKIKDKEQEFLAKIFGIGFGKWKKMMNEHIDKYYDKFDPEELIE